MDFTRACFGLRRELIKLTAGLSNRGLAPERTSKHERAYRQGEPGLQSGAPLMLVSRTTLPGYLALPCDEHTVSVPRESSGHCEHRIPNAAARLVRWGGQALSL